jgi:phosphonatase-like hydrolase
MLPIQLVVFDMAGTTVSDQDEVRHCFQEAADLTGLQADPAALTAMMGWSKKRVFQTLWQAQLGDSHPDYEARVKTSFSKFKVILEDHYRIQPVMPTEGCLELFAWLKQHDIYIALNTGFYREVTNIILHRLGWDQGLNTDYVGSPQSMIQASVTPSEIYNQEGRPAPFMIQKAMYRLGVCDPKAVITIGDTPSDIEAGMNAGCRLSLGITRGSHTREELARYPNDGLVDSLLELKGAIAP